MGERKLTFICARRSSSTTCSTTERYETPALLFKMSMPPPVVRGLFDDGFALLLARDVERTDSHVFRLTQLVQCGARKRALTGSEDYPVARPTKRTRHGETDSGAGSRDQDRLFGVIGV